MWHVPCYDVSEQVAFYVRLCCCVAGIPASQQHLIWQSSELDDVQCLQDCHIHSGATLRLVLNMRGGPINIRRGMEIFVIILIVHSVFTPRHYVSTPCKLQQFCTFVACECCHIVEHIITFLSASLYFSKRGAYCDRLCHDVVGRWLVGWLSRACTVAKWCILGL